MLEPTTTQLRNTLRQTFRERRLSLSAKQQRTAAELLIEQVKTHRLLDEVRKLAIYITNDGELDTAPLIKYLWSLNIEVYLPVLHPFCDGQLLFLRYHEDSPMVANLYGIAEPRLDCTAVCPLRELDLLFTPLVAFDDRGNRLGMGGGFYDRTLASIYHKDVQKPRIVGLAHDIQQTLSLPTEAWDIPLPTIMTPTKFFSFA